MYFFLFKSMQISKNFPVIMQYPGLFAGSVEQPQEFGIPGTIQFIGIAIASDISLFHTGKMPVQLGIEVFPVSLPERHTHIETEDALYLCLDAALENSLDILPGIIDKGKNRA